MDAIGAAAKPAATARGDGPNAFTSWQLPVRLVDSGVGFRPGQLRFVEASRGISTRALQGAQHSTSRIEREAMTVGRPEHPDSNARAGPARTALAYHAAKHEEGIMLSLAIDHARRIYAWSPGCHDQATPRYARGHPRRQQRGCAYNHLERRVV